MKQKLSNEKKSGTSTSPVNEISDAARTQALELIKANKEKRK